jgi:FkbM family methyltransferase
VGVPADIAESEGARSEFNRLKRCRYGTMLYNINDIYIGRSFELYGEFSEGEVGLFRQILRPGMLVVDVGANIGAHSLALARIVGEGGRVLAIEPQRLPFQTLCANMAINSIVNATCVPCALGRAPGWISVPNLNPYARGNFGGVSLGNRDSGERVEVRTLDSFELGQCHLIKIDAEGMESEVLEGARDTIARCEPVLYVENDRPEKSAELVRLIASFGYRLYPHEPPLFNPDNFARNDANVFERIVSRNLLCIPADVAISIQDGREIKVPAP